MNILMVNHLLDPVSGGGTAERTYQIGRFLARTGVSCTILTLDIGVTEERLEGLQGVKVFALPCRNTRFFLPRFNALKIRELVATADIVLLSGNWTLLNALVFRACQRLSKPYLFCPAGALQPFGRSLWLKHIYELAVGRRLAGSAAACIAVTEAERSEFIARGIANEQIVVIPNGIDPDAYQLSDPEGAIAEVRRFLGVDNSRFILFLGRLNVIKGPDILLEAFGRLSSDFADVHLVFAGPDDGMEWQLREAAAAGGIAGRVHFVGYVGGSRKVAALRAATLLAIPSRREAMSIVVLEGGICDCPVLFSDACGLEALAAVAAGLMVSPDAKALAEGIMMVLGDPSAARERAVRLHRMIHQDFLWEVQARRHIELAHNLVDGGVISLSGQSRVIEG